MTSCTPAKRRAPRGERAAAPVAPPLGGAPILVAALVAALCVAAAVTYRIYDPDIWNHLAVGRAIWQLHAIPATQIWTWPDAAAPNVLPSWLFRAVLWPFWAVGDVTGLYAWRWLTALATFGLLGLAVRRMGARGLVPLVALVWCALIYRQRSQMRPETLAAALMAAQLFLLEARRHGGRDRSWWIVGIAIVWANVHVSYYLGLALTGFYLVDDLWRARREPRRPWRLGLVLALSAAASFINPFGGRVLAQPFEYLLSWRHEAMFRSIDELGPILWEMNLRNGLPALMALTVVLAIRRWRRKGPDVAEVLVLGAFMAQAFMSQRFLGCMAVGIAPFLARDLADWAKGWRLPGWAMHPWARAGLVSAGCLVITTVEVTRPAPPFGISIDEASYPVRACDYVQSARVRGRPFNEFSLGGYMLWRFWPERLPFFDIHPESHSREMRASYYAGAYEGPAGWAAIDRRYRFDWLLLPARQPSAVPLLNLLDADSTWALVFADDAAVVFVRRSGINASLASRDGYAALPAGPAALRPLGARTESDSSLREALRLDLERAVSGSPWNGNAHSLLAGLEMQEGKLAEAEAHLRAVAQVAPDTPHLNERLGMIRLGQGHPKEALAEFERARGLAPRDAVLAHRIGQAHQALGDRDAARAAYRRSLGLDPNFAPSRDSLAVLGGG